MTKENQISKDQMPLFLRVEDVSDLLSINPNRVRSMLRKKEIVGAKIANKWLVQREDIIEFFNNNKNVNPHEPH
ncbi:MAG: helix-turn-helix domain-containing protein [Bacteroidota bacterium]